MWQLPDLTHPYWFLIIVLVLLVIITGRYFLVAGLFYCLFYVWFRERWQQHKLHQRSYARKQFVREVKYSMITGAIFSVAGAFALVLWQKGYTQVYTDVFAYGLWYLPLSFLLSLLMHETYYYWVHRWMHRPCIFRWVHKVHHDSNITSPWTAFSFHPLESVLQSVILPLILMVVPLHPYVILAQLVFMSISSVINHLEIEIFPPWFYRHPIGRWLIGATHHSLHHKQFKYNYGLYFTFLDKLHKTESPAYEKK
jgi:Sterol desaturase